MSFEIYKKNGLLYEVRFLIKDEISKKGLKYAQEKYNLRKIGIDKKDFRDFNIFYRRERDSKSKLAEKLSALEISYYLNTWLEQEDASKTSEFSIHSFFNLLSDPCIAEPDTNVYSVDSGKRSFAADLERSGSRKIHVKNQEEKMMKSLTFKKNRADNINLTFNPSGVFQKSSGYGAGGRGNSDYTFYNSHAPGDVTADTVTYRDRDGNITAMGIWCCADVPLIHQKKLMGQLVNQNATKEALWRSDLDRANATWSGLTPAQIQFLMDQAVEVPSPIATMRNPFALNSL